MLPLPPTLTACPSFQYVQIYLVNPFTFVIVTHTDLNCGDAFSCFQSKLRNVSTGWRLDWSASFWLLELAHICRFLYTDNFFSIENFTPKSNRKHPQITEKYPWLKVCGVCDKYEVCVRAGCRVAQFRSLSVPSVHILLVISLLQKQAQIILGQPSSQTWHGKVINHHSGFPMIDFAPQPQLNKRLLSNFEEVGCPQSLF